MNKILVLTTVVLSACSTATPPRSEVQTTVPAQTASSTQNGSRAQALGLPQEQTAPGAAPAAGEVSLNDLNGMTFSCSKVGLNAAAREAAKAPAKGSYQFSYFRLVSSSHHSSFEVHFKSNNYEDPDLKYCVSVYCRTRLGSKTCESHRELDGQSSIHQSGRCRRRPRRRMR